MVGHALEDGASSHPNLSVIRLCSVLDLLRYTPRLCLHASLSVSLSLSLSSLLNFLSLPESSHQRRREVSGLFSLSSPKKDNTSPDVDSKLTELNESRVELLNRIQNLKQDLQSWRGKLDTQVKVYSEGKVLKEEKSKNGEETFTKVSNRVRRWWKGLKSSSSTKAKYEL